MPFNVQNAIRELLAAGCSDVTDIAAKVAHAVPADDLVEVLAQALTSSVRQVIGTDRRSSLLFTAELEAVDAPVVRPPSRSPKREAIAAAYRESLRVLLRAEDGMKAFGDFTMDDCLFAAHQRFDLARQVQHQAERLEHWAALLQKYGVSTVKELPASVLLTLPTPAALAG